MWVCVCFVLFHGWREGSHKIGNKGTATKCFVLVLQLSMNEQRRNFGFRIALIHFCGSAIYGSPICILDVVFLILQLFHA